MTNVDHLPYHPDSTLIFSKLLNRHWPVFLDSSSSSPQQSRYDIITADPFVTFCTQDHITTIQTHTKTQHSQANPFDLVQDYLTQYPCHRHNDLPFCGGALGYFGYDLAPFIEPSLNMKDNDIVFPDMAVGLYDWAIIVDHQRQESIYIHQHLTAQANTVDNAIRSLLSQPSAPQHTPYQVQSPIKSNFTLSHYRQAFQRIKHHIRNGDCYQVNLAQRFAINVAGSSWQLYQTIRQRNPAPFSAFIQYPQGAVLSFSPERFLSVQNGAVQSQPIKGTRKRAHCPISDKKITEDLLNSTKDNAENIMIVDLMRNDLNKNCQPGTVKVPELCTLKSFAAVHHLVSTVTGQLRPDSHPMQLLRDAFPGGSITGAPKLRVMQIINQLEPNRRKVYCGAIGYINFNGDLDTNIAIRTLIHTAQTLYCWAGGGIVYDSELNAEYQETFDKVAYILQVLQQTPLASQQVINESL